MNIAQSLERAARFHPGRTALIFRDRRWTFAELDARASALAAGLRSLGLGPGDRLGLHLPNSPEFVLTYYAACKLGVVPISLNVTYRPAEIAYIINDGGAVAIATSAAVAGNLPPAAEMPSVKHVLRAGAGPAGAIDLDALGGDPGVRALDLDRTETCAILYTSATTGWPKGVMLSHENVVSNTWAVLHHLRMTPADVGLCALPLFHCFGQNFIMNALVHAGAALVLHERFVLDEFMAAVAARRVTLLYAVPTMYILMLAAGAGREGFASLRLCFSAAASLPGETERRWKERTGHDIHQGYGLTESSPFASYNHDTAFRPGSIGTPIENVEMRIADPVTGAPVADGELGEIAIRGPNVMKGYFGNPAATAEAIRGGWLHSGDIGYRDADGYFYVVDRVKDMINVSGFKVFPREVEEVLFLHPAVEEVAVLGRPDPVRGEAVKAFVVLKPGQTVDPEALRALCRERIAPYKVPEDVEFIAALPKNPTGKILKKELRASRQAGTVHERRPPSG
jgi:long-chain acyl-CoA synthetase